MRTLDIDTTEALFKLALEKKDYPEVMRMVRGDTMNTMIYIAEKIS